LAQSRNALTALNNIKPVKQLSHVSVKKRRYLPEWKEIKWCK